MIFTEVVANVNNLINLETYHIETANITSNDLTKRIIRVISDHGNEFGIRLHDDSRELEHGSVFFIDDNRLLILSVIPDEMIVITPKDIDEMGEIAHLLGNTHKPISVENGKIKLALDPVVLNVLNHKYIEYKTEKIILNKPLKHVNLAHSHE